MAKKKQPAGSPEHDQAPDAGVSIGQKIANVVDHLIHPDADKSEAGAADAPAAETEIDHAPAAESVESGMQDHKKFDKFK